MKTVIKKPNAQGVYFATIEVFDFVNQQWKSKSSSMFPLSWNSNKIINEIQGAYRNMDMLDGNKWGGVSPSGIRIEGFLDAKGGINTAYPIY